MALTSIPAVALSLAAVAVYPHPFSPEENPDYGRHAAKPPSRTVFGEGYGFTTFRHLNKESFRRNVDLFTVSNDMGNVVWPDWGCLFDKNLPTFVREIKARGLVLFDPWGYVPSNDDGNHGFWRQFHLPTETLSMLERELGERWTGMDNGEQDWRYFSAFNWRFDPNPGEDRFRHYLNFRRHFGHLENELGNRLTALVGSFQTHALLREGVYTMVGAETSQMYPNAQLFYSYIRGAGKQFGVPWFGNVSIFNRFGWKDVGQTNLSVKAEGHMAGRADKGTSLALMKKLTYAQMFYNCWLGGFEGGCFFRDGTITPIGILQREARRWSKENGEPGTMCAPVAIMTDVFSGWNAPRTATWPTGWRNFRTWGLLPFGPGDYLTHGVWDLLYPGYADSSFFHDERGYIAPTPFGDIADGVLSDAPGWLLRQYAVVVLAGRIAASAETADVLRDYVRGGGHLVLTRGNERTLFPDGFGVRGGGRVTLVPSEWGVEETPQCALPIKVSVDQPLPNPHPLTAETRRILTDVFAGVRLFGTGAEPVDEGLATITCRRGDGEYTLCVQNSTWEQRPLALTSFVGPIESIRELPTDVSERTAIGFLPWSISNVVIGADSPTTIAAGATRLFRVKVAEGNAVKVLPREKPPANPVGRTLAMNGPGTIREFILRRPTFFRHWDGVKVSASYLLRNERAVLKEEGDWCRRQGLHVMVDFTDLTNGFDGMRLLATDEDEAKRTTAMLDDVLAKAPLLGAKECILALHPSCCNGRRELLKENAADMEKTYRQVAAKIAAAGLTAHLRMSSDRLTPDFAKEAAWVAKAGTEAVRPTVSVAAMMAMEKVDVAKKLSAAAACPEGLWLLAATGRDAANGTVWTFSDTLAANGAEVRPYLELAVRKNARVVFEAAYGSPDDEYLDARLFESILSR